MPRERRSFTERFYFCGHSCWQTLCGNSICVAAKFLAQQTRQNNPHSASNKNELREQRQCSNTLLSPSGTCVHVVVRAALPGKGRRSGKIEIYDSARYFTMTGNQLLGAPIEIRERQIELDQLLHEFFPVALRAATSASPELSSLSDEELVRRAQSARNGERFLRLWNGDSSEYGADRSRADAALCCMLAYWCGGDAGRVDRLFRRSGLMRGKWDGSQGTPSIRR